MYALLGVLGFEGGDEFSIWRMGGKLISTTRHPWDIGMKRVGSVSQIEPHHYHNPPRDLTKGVRIYKKPGMLYYNILQGFILAKIFHILIIFRSQFYCNFFP